ncbi:MAG TPA: ABC transporter ATP-binding protein [Alphaproteobacteria bacterium]|nr:ABC transporter ATP-binding protein [Alphaproteobacteria bacterium]
MRNRLAGYVAFARQCATLLADNKAIFAVFLVVSLLGALTEGLTISLLVPILDNQGGQGSFAGVPYFGAIAGLFGEVSPSERIEIAAIAIAVLIVLRNLLQFSVDALSAVIPLRLQENFANRGYRALMEVEIGFIHAREYGVLFNGVSGWAKGVTMLLTNVATVVWGALIVAIYLVMMLAISVPLTLLSIAFMGGMSLVLRWLTSGPLRRAGKRSNDAVGRVNQLLMESVGGMKVIRLASAETTMIGAFGAAVRNSLEAERGAAKIQATVQPVMTAGAGLFICALLLGNAAFNASNPNAWVGSILLFLFLLYRLVGPIGNINGARARIVKYIHSFDMLNEFYRETAAARQPNGTRAFEAWRRDIAFDRVSFAYAKADAPALHDVSTRIERGTMVAIVGPSGAGKTTFISLLARLYDPREGSVRIDGTDLREFDVRGWRHHLAVVTQDTFIFNDTAARNIAFGRENATLDEIRNAARLAAADEFIAGMPEGYDTVLGDRGVRLSGGQQQRIAIARAVLANPDLLILDEATSHLDTFTERAIQDAIDRVSRECTVVVIAHRLSTVRRADKVIVMEGGRIVEEGSHKALMARRGLYWEMVEHQRFDMSDEASAASA